MVADLVSDYEALGSSVARWNLNHFAAQETVMAKQPTANRQAQGNGDLLNVDWRAVLVLFIQQPTSRSDGLRVFRALSLRGRFALRLERLARVTGGLAQWTVIVDTEHCLPLLGEVERDLDTGLDPKSAFGTDKTLDLRIVVRV